MIRAENLSFCYPDHQAVLKQLNFTIAEGEFVAIVGQNGSGKTTLLKHFNGLLKPTGGRMLIGELDVSRVKTSQLATRVGFLFQNPDHQIFCRTVEDEIAFGLKMLGLPATEIGPRVGAAAEQVGIASLLRQDPFSLSKGQRQRVALASVLVLETEILVLDEPTTGQDYQEGLQIIELIARLNLEGKTVIVVTHDLELVARYARRVIILAGGRIAGDGPVDTILSNQRLLARCHLQPPQISLLAEHFQRLGLFRNVFTVDEMFQAITDYLGGEKIARLN